MIFQGATCNQPTLNSVEMQAEQQVIQDAAQAPHVHGRRVLGVTQYDLRRAVPVRDEAVSISAAALVQHSASHSEIGYFRSRPEEKRRHQLY